MIVAKISIDPECVCCKEALEELVRLMGSRVCRYCYPSFTLLPDINSAGVITHWHIERSG